MENKYNGWYYGNTSKWEKNRIDKFIEKNKDKKLWILSLFFSTKRLIKYQRTNGLIFWNGWDNGFDECKSSDLTKYNGLFTFEEAFELAKDFPLLNGELIKIDYDMENYVNPNNHDASTEHLILVKD